MSYLLSLIFKGIVVEIERTDVENNAFFAELKLARTRAAIFVYQYDSDTTPWYIVANAEFSIAVFSLLYLFIC